MNSPALSPVSLPKSLRQFLIVLIALVALCCLAEVVCARVLHLHYPYNWPLMFLHPSFMDFRWYFAHFATFHTADFFIGPDLIMYPAPVVLCYRFFYTFQPVATAVFLSFIFISTLTAAILAGRSLIRRGLALSSTVLLVATTFLLAYPLWFEFKQGNMEIVVWVVLSLGLVSFLKQRPLLAAVFFGLAGAMKFYPIIFLALLLTTKRYRECVVGCLVTAATIFVSVWFVGPTIPIAWHGMQHGLEVFRSQFMVVVRPNEIGFDHSLFAGIKSIIAAGAMAHIYHFPSLAHRSTLLTTYLAVAAVAGTILYFLRIRHLPLANQVLCLTLAVVVLPPVSFDYTLLHLYAPWLMLCFVAIKAHREGTTVPGLQPLLLCLAVVFAPLSEFIIKGERFGGEIKALFLLAIFYYALRYPFYGAEPHLILNPTPSPKPSEASLHPLVTSPNAAR